MVTELNSNQYDTSPTISPDGLTIWFVSYRTGGPGGGDFYVAKRANRSAAWAAPQLVTELNTPGYEDALAIDPTGHIGYFHSTRAGGMNSQIFRTTRASATDPWSAPAAVTELASTYDDANVWISPDDCIIYFDSTRPGGLGQYDIFRATRPAPGARFNSVEPVTELNGTLYDADPFLSADQRHIIYTSNRPSGDFNIYEATR
jgi:Tol biopolymer transport system component